MNINELTEKLRQKYTKTRDFSVVKIDDKEWKNIYFVIPPAPPKKIEEKLPYALIGEALKIIGFSPNYSQINQLSICKKRGCAIFMTKFICNLQRQIVENNSNDIL